MRIVRFLVLAVAIGSVSIALAPIPASAGGSPLETTRRDHYAVGQRVVARGNFGRGYNEGTVADGPYYAYLVPEDRYLPGNGDVPGWAVPLGEMEIWDGAGRICCWIARVEFVVPNVAPGYYRIGYCNADCTITGVGSLTGGGIWVGRTLHEARLIRQVRAAELENEGLERRLRRAENRADRLAEERGAVDITTLRARVASLGRAPRDTTATVPTDRPWPVGAWLLLVVGGAAAGSLIGWSAGRRRPRPSGSSHDGDRLVLAEWDQVPARQPETSRGRPGLSRPAPPRTKSYGTPLQRPGSEP